MFIPKISHELALKKLAQYLNNTQERGLVLDPNYDIFKVDAYPYSDLAGMYGHKNYNDPACAKSCTGFNIMFSGFPVLWISKFQTETDLSTMEAEIIALDHFFKSFFR